MRSQENFFQSFFHNFLGNIVNIFSPRNLAWMFGAVLVTYVSVTTGFDWYYFNFARNGDLRDFFLSVGLIGFAVPVFVPIILLLLGSIGKNTKLRNIGFGLGQAAFLGWLLSSFFKFFTGRPGPPLHALADSLTNISTQFRFGLGDGGIFWGWPSSHTAVAFAMAFALIFMFPKNKTVRFFAIVYALYIGIGVSLSFHWFSDFIAGAILGALIGIAVGKSFKRRYEILAR